LLASGKPLVLNSSFQTSVRPFNVVGAVFAPSVGGVTGADAGADAVPETGLDAGSDAWLDPVAGVGACGVSGMKDAPTALPPPQQCSAIARRP